MKVGAVGTGSAAVEITRKRNEISFTIFDSIRFKIFIRYLFKANLNAQNTGRTL